METKINLSISGDKAIRVLRALITKVDDTQNIVAPLSGTEEVSRIRPYSGNIQHIPLTAEQKTTWARERRSLVNFKITQTGPYQDALIIEHVRGSLYRVMLVDGNVINVKHKKQVTLGGNELGAGWSKWVN
jgi:hypothetical protein